MSRAPEKPAARPPEEAGAGLPEDVPDGEWTDEGGPMSGTYDLEVRITPREGILDPEGETIARALGNLGYEGVARVRAGRLVHLRLQAESPEAARRSAERMCEELIANPLIEDYTVAVRNGSGPDASVQPGGDAAAESGGGA